MMKITVKPVPGLVVRKPDGSHLAGKGETVVANSYWRRRVADGSVIIVSHASKDSKKKQGGGA